MNHSLDIIKPFKEMRDDVRSGDIVTIYFPHTKITGHIEENKPWGRYGNLILDGDDFRLSLHSSEGSSDGLGLNFPMYGVNSKKGTINQQRKHYEMNPDEVFAVKAIGYSVVKRQYDYQIKGFIDGKIHNGGINGAYPVNGETDADNRRIRGVLFAKSNYGPTAGVLMYADQSGKYIERAVMLTAPYPEEKLARQYNGNEIMLVSTKAALTEKAGMKTEDKDRRLKVPFTFKSLEAIIDKKIDFVLDNNACIVDIIQL